MWLVDASSDLATPPIGELLGLRPVAASEGTATFSLPAHGWLAQPLGFVQGDVTGCLADSAMSAAVQTTVADGRAFARTICGSTSCVHCCPTAAGSRRQPRSCTAAGQGLTRVDVVNAEGKIVAMATSTSLYR